MPSSIWSSRPAVRCRICWTAWSFPPEEKGITFINGSLAALPGLDSDRGVVLQDGDRVGISHRRSMWPFQYRFGASQTDDLADDFRERERPGHPPRLHQGRGVAARAGGQ